MRTAVLFLFSALAWSEDHATRLVQDLQRYSAEGDFFAASQLIAEAQAEVQRLGIGDLKSIALVNQIGIVQQMLGQYLDAEQTYSSAIQKLEKLDSLSPGLAYLLLNLASTHIENCDGPVLAGELAQRALSLATYQFGPNSPRLGIYLFTLGSALQQQGRRDEALQLYRQALGFSEHFGGPATELDTYLVALLYQSLGLIETLEHNWQDATRHLAGAIDLHVQVQGPGNPNLIRPYLTLARLHMLRQEWTQAGECLATARQIAEAQLAPNHPILTEILAIAAELQRKTGHAGNARALERQARELRAAAPPGTGGATLRVHVRDLASKSR